MGIVAHVDDRKKELVKEANCLARLGVTMNDSNEGGIHVHNGSKSLWIVDVKAKQDMCPTLVEL